MDTVSIIVLISNSICGLLFLALGIPLARGNVRRNHLYGFRFEKSLRSEANWREINAYGGRRMIAWSAVVLISAAVPLLMPLSKYPYLTLLVVLVPCTIVVPCIQSYRYAQRLPD